MTIYYSIFVFFSFLAFLPPFLPIFHVFMQYLTFYRSFMLTFSIFFFPFQFLKKKYYCNKYRILRVKMLRKYEKMIDNQ